MTHIPHPSWELGKTKNPRLWITSAAKAHRKRGKKCCVTRVIFPIAQQMLVDHWCLFYLSNFGPLNPGTIFDGVR